MRIITLSSANPQGGCAPIDLGYVGENGVTRVTFDFSAWAAEYGAGTIQLEVLRFGDELPYLATVTTEGTVASWEVSNVDTGVEGVGAAGWVYYVNEQVKKSAVFRFAVARDVGGPVGPSPDPYESIISYITELARSAGDSAAAAVDAETGAKAAKETAEAAQGASETAAGNAEAWAVGQRGGVDVPSTDPTYQNNSKYYADRAAALALVSSVNGQTGDVLLDAEDVGAIPNTATLDDIPDGSTYAKATPAQLQQIGTNAGDIDAIEGKIPAAASEQNKLADKAFVTDSITQSTAIYRGSFASKAALLAVAWQTSDPNAANYVSNNDYAVVLDDETHSDACWRYIYVTGAGWTAQYQINESPLTQAQLDALNSGITAAGVQQIGTNAENIATLNTNKQAKITASGMLKGDGAGGVSAAAAGTDYLAPAALNPYRTAAVQDVIDAAQDANIDKALEVYDSTTVSGSIVTFDAPGELPLKDLVVSIEPVQSGSGDPSPTNVRPISGWTGCNVTRMGVNLWDEDWEVGSIDNNTGANVYFNTVFRSKNYIPVIPGGTFYFYCGDIKNLGSQTTMPIYCYGKDKEYLGLVATPMAVNNSTFTVPDNCYFIRFRTGTDFPHATVYQNDISINYPASDVDYHSYAGITYPITFPSEAGTVSVGTLDVENHKLTVEYIKIFLKTLTWTVNTALDHTFTATIADRKPGAVNFYSDFYEIKTSATMAESDYCISFSTGDTYKVYVRDIRAVTVNDFMSILNSDNSAIAYSLNSPSEISLTDVPNINTLLGQNNIWADCGDVTVTYGAYLEAVNDHSDTEDKTTRAMLAPVESGATASTNYAIGDMLVFVGKLCKATATIVTGDTLVIGTGGNLTSTTVAEQLALLLAIINT